MDLYGTPIKALFVDLLLDAHDRAPKEIVDLDDTDVPFHDHQEGRFSHGYF